MHSYLVGATISRVNIFQCFIGFSDYHGSLQMCTGNRLCLFMESVDFKEVHSSPIILCFLIVKLICLSG